MSISSDGGSHIPAAEKQLRFLLQHSPSAMALFDCCLRYVEASRRWCECFAPSGQWRGRTHAELFPAQPEPWHEACARALQGQAVETNAVRVESSDGGVRWFTFAAHPWSHDDGAAGGVYVFAEEQTQQYELRAQRNRTESILHTAMDAILAIDEQQRIVLFNRAAETIFQCSAEEALGSPLDRFLPSEFRAAHPQYVHRFGATGETTRTMHSPKRLMALRSDGERFPIEATISKSGAGDERIYTVILRDVSVRQRTEEAMLRAEKLASAGRMAVSLAHEINNPLASLTNALYLVESHPLPDEARRFLKIAGNELQRVVHLTQQSLGFYRESGTPEPVAVPEVIDSAVSMLEGKIKRNHGHIERQWKTSLRVLGIAGELRQIIANLLANSLDAMAHGGTVRFRTASARLPNGREAVRITISDNGHGIPQPIRPHIFEPFYTTKGDFGTGLGLWVSKQLVDKQGGRIRLRSRDLEPCRGTVISLLLPAATAADAAD